MLLWSDEAAWNLEGRVPKFPEEERLYFLEAIRYVHDVIICRRPAGPDELPLTEGFRPQTWAVDEADNNDAKRAYCRSHGLQYRVVRQQDLASIPDCVPEPAGPSDRGNG